MATTSYKCSLKQGYNFQKDAQQTVGHILKLKIAETEFTPDTEVMDPTKITDKQGKEKVVGVIYNMFWPGGFAQPVSFNCQLSTANQQQATLLQHNKLSNTNVEFSFVVYDYDPRKKAYYPAFHTQEDQLKGLIEKRDGKLEFDIDMVQSNEVVSPRNYAFYLSVMPQEEEQDIQMATCLDGKFAKKWGVAVAV